MMHDTRITRSHFRKKGITVSITFENIIVDWYHNNYRISLTVTIMSMIPYSIRRVFYFYYLQKYHFFTQRLLYLFTLYNIQPIATIVVHYYVNRSNRNFNFLTRRVHTLHSDSRRASHPRINHNSKFSLVLKSRQDWQNDCGITFTLTKNKEY